MPPVRAVVLVLTSLLLAFGVAAAKPSLPGPHGVKPAVSAEARQCRARGGEWRPVCRRQIPRCVMLFSDAGRRCTDNSQCAGRRCLYQGGLGDRPTGPVTGACAANDDPCGCTAEVVQGRIANAMCAD